MKKINPCRRCSGVPKQSTADPGVSRQTALHLQGVKAKHTYDDVCTGTTGMPKR